MKDLELRRAGGSRRLAGHTTMDRDSDLDSRFRGFNRLSHEELSKTNDWKTYPRKNKTCNLELEISSRHDSGLRG